MNTIVFIGGGNMASAIIGGLLKSGRPAGSVIVVEPFDAQRDKLRAEFGVHALEAADASLAQATLVVWAVKPQSFRAAAAPCAPHVAGGLHLSVMAGIRSSAIARATGTQRVVRAMPNTPALIGQGIAGLYAHESVTPQERAEVEAVLAPTGRTLWVAQEADLDTVTALSGSGPAYIFLILEALSDAVVVLDRRGYVVAANQRFSAAFGAAGAAIPGRPCPRVGNCMPGDALNTDTPCVACEIAHSRQPRRVLQILPDSTGQRRRWEATLNPVLDDLGAVSLVVEVWRDITDRSQLEAQLAHSERLASLGLLAAGVAHELNNPLASVLAGVESLQRLVDRVTLPADEGDEAREVLRLLEQETRRCSETTDKLLLLGQQHSSRPVWIDLNRASLDTLALLRFATRKQGIVVHTQLTDGLPPVWGREGALRGTLMNLCLNAVQAMPGGGQFTIRTRSAADAVVFEVEDDGRGIAPDRGAGAPRGHGLVNVAERLRLCFGPEGGLAIEPRTPRGTLARIVIGG